VLLGTTALVAVTALLPARTQAASPIDTNQAFYPQSQVGVSVNPDFQGGTLRLDVNAVTDTHAYNVETFPTNTIDEFGNTVTFTGSFSGTGPLTLVDSVGGGNVIVTGANIIGGAVTISSGATLTWGNGITGAFLIGPGNAVTDNGSLVMDFGAGSSVAGQIPISGTGSVTIHTGILTELGPATYTGGTTIDAAGVLQLASGGGTSGTVAGNIADNGLLQFNYAGPAVTAANAISGTGSAEFQAGTTVITSASAIGGTVTIDAGATAQWGDGTTGAFLVGGGNAVTDNGALVMNFGGSGIVGNLPLSGTGTLEIQSGLFVQTGAATLTGTTTIDAGGQLQLNGAGSFANTSNMIDNGIFDISGTTAGASIKSITGSGQVSLGAQTLTLTNASGTFSGVMADGGAAGGTGGGLTIASGTETLTGTNTFTGATTINPGATLQLGNGGTTGSVAGNIVDNGLVRFNYSGPVTIAGGISGTGNAEVVAGTAVFTGFGTLGGTVTIDPGATMQWGNGAPGFLVGAGNAVVDNGALVMNFGGGGIAGAIPISGMGSVTLQSGSLNDSGVSTYTGSTTIDAAGFLALSLGGSISNSSVVNDNGVFDISQTTAGTSIHDLTGTGMVSLGAQTLTLTNATGTFSGVLADGGIAGGTGGGLTIAGGTETLTGTNTFTGATTINSGATLQLGNGGTTGSVAGNIVDNGLVRFNYSGPVTVGNTFSGSGNVEIAAGTPVVTGLSFVGGTVTIDPGATMQWGAGAGAAFLIGGGNAVVDNGSLVLNFGGGNSLTGPIPISGTGSLTVQSGLLINSGVSTYTGATTINSGASIQLTGSGSISNSSGVSNAGSFDISGTTAGTSIKSITGSGTVSLGARTLTLTNASGIFSGVMANGGIFGGTGGGLTIAGGTETLTGTNTFTGATTINPGATLQLGNGGTTGSIAGNVIDNGTFAINHTDAVTFANVISGTGAFQQNGTGTTTLSGINTYTGATMVNAGTLSVNGSIATSSLLTVHSGGTVGGTGTLPSTVITSGGTLAPGNSIGTITVNGNLTFNTGSTYSVEVSPSAADRTNVTGTASLAGIVNAAFAPGSYITHNYTILSATGGLGGTTFSTLSTSSLVNFSVGLSYTSTDVLLNLTAALGAGTGLPGNQQSVANGINNSFNGGGTLPPNFSSLFGLSGNALSTALSQVSGEAATDAQQVAFQLMNEFLGLMLDPYADGRAGMGGTAAGFAAEQRAGFPVEVANAYAAVLKAPASKAPSFEQRWSAWASGFGGYNTTTGDAGAGTHDFTARTYGGAAGVDYRVNPGTLIGFALAGAGTNWSLAQGLGGGRSDAFQAGLYGKTHFGAAYVAGALAFANHWMSTDRFAFGSDHLTADFNAYSVGGRIEAGYRYGFPVLAVTPYAALQAQTFHTPSYSETDLTAGGFGLAYNSANATDTRTELGARFAKAAVVSNDALLILRARLAWAHDWISNPSLTAAFQALPGSSFIVNGAALPENSALVSAGAELRLANGVSLLAKFDGDFGSGSHTYAGTGTLRYTW
jgi:outer membrane autotransporter protein